MNAEKPYQITAVVRRGQGIALFRAVRCKDGVPVVLEVPDPNNSRPEDLERLKHEYAIGTTLQGPAVVRPLALETHQGLPTLVLENFDGKSLDQLDRPMGTDGFLRLAVAMTVAVADLHRQGVIHKDLKPESFFVQPMTGEVKIADFGIASRLPFEQRAPRSLGRIEGSLPYMSPEQTGWMNRALDSRTDLYSLGITFYEMLTGGLPFQARDPLEWVYCHVAVTPPSPSEAVSDVPEGIACIVTKLLAKMPEDRYQSARGLAHDLKRCLEQWNELGRIEPFPLGERDMPDRLRIPQKLYGREKEIAALVHAFERVAETGSPELVLVSGHAGVGKSALIHELYKPVACGRGFFVSGKFDQYKRDIPYSTIVQTSKDLVREILTESEERVEGWRQKLRDALGINGQLIVDVIPQVELIIGDQPPVPALPPAEAQNRFRIVLRQFIGAFAQKDHPLALFFDDLQWADSASLEILEDLMTHPDIRYLLIVGAYRDNEVSSSHPLVLTVDRARKSEANVSNIMLESLSGEHLAALVGDALNCSSDRAAPLAELINEKTAGNPFFAIQFLIAASDEHLIELDEQSGAWRWDVSKIRAKGFTDNVADLMVGRLKRLPAATREAVKRAACLGNSAETAVLVVVLGRPAARVHEDLWDAVSGGLLLQIEGTYKFAHDRIQEAAYSLIPEDARPSIHVEIGRLLLAKRPVDVIDGQVFDIAHHFNRGVGLMTDSHDRTLVANLNLQAGRRAKASAAYGSASTYFAAGIALLPSDAWATQYDVAIALHLGRAECAYINGEFDEVERLSSHILKNARTNTQRASIYRIEIDLHTTKGEFAKALASGIECLRLCGIDLPANPTAEQVHTEEQLVWKLIGERQIEELIDLPSMTNPDMVAALDILSAMHPPAHFLDNMNLFLIIPACMTNISLRHGNALASAMGYATFGVIIGHQFGKFREAYRFGKLASDMVDRSQMSAYRSKVHFLMGGCISCYAQPFARSLEYLDRSLQAAVETGDMPFACYSGFDKLAFLFINGSALGEVYEESRKWLEFALKAKFEPIMDAVITVQRMVQSLRGHKEHFGLMSDARFDEDAFEARLRQGFIHDFCWYQVNKLQLRFWAGDYVSALRAADELKERLWPIFGEPVVFEYDFYTALAMTALHPDAPAEQQRDFEKALERILEKHDLLADNCPENFSNRRALVSAEIARIEGRELDAERAYEQAIGSARENGFIQNEGLAHELASKFYRARGLDLVADTYLREARACYVRWGAGGKVRQIDERYARLLEAKSITPISRSNIWGFGSPSASFASPTVSVGVEQVDLLSIVKASQTISGDIVLDKLLRTLLEVVLHEGGARRGCLILPRAEDLSIEAEAFLQGKSVETRVLQSQPLSSALVPVSVVRFAVRTKERVILNDPAEGSKYALDPYVVRVKPRSVLCLPIVRQGEVVGLLYLENNLLDGAFTPERLAALELLASQAAISLENALLLAQERAARAAAEEAERRSAFLADAGTLLSESLDYEQTLAHLGQLCVQSLCDWCVIDIVEGADIRRISVAHRDPVKLPLLEELQRRFPPRADSPHPSSTVLRTGKPLLFPDLSNEVIQTLVVNDEHLRMARELGAQSAMIVPLVAHGQTLGVLSVVSSSPERHYTGVDMSLMQEVARRAAIAIDNAQLYRKTQEAISARDEFLSVASHELNTPVASLMLAIQTMNRAMAAGRFPDEHAVRTLVDRILRQGTRLVRLNREMLDVSRIHANRLSLDLADVDLGVLVREIVEQFQPELAQSGCSVSMHGDKRIVGYWDRSRIDQIFTNILSNAIKFGAGKPIEISIGEEVGKARIAVRDHGIGIDPALQDRVFERFERAVSDRHYGGLGLGLYISRRLAEAHGGSIRVRSELGAGSTFIVELPCAGPPAFAGHDPSGGE